MLKRWVVVLSFAAALAVATGAALSQRTTQSPAPVGAAAPRGANPEAQEEDEVTAERLEALGALDEACRAVHAGDRAFWAETICQPTGRGAGATSQLSNGERPAFNEAERRLQGGPVIG